MTNLPYLRHTNKRLKGLIKHHNEFIEHYNITVENVHGIHEGCVDLVSQINQHVNQYNRLVECVEYIRRRVY